MAKRIGPPTKLKPLYVGDTLGGPPIPVARLCLEHGGIVLNLVQIDKCEIQKLIQWLRKAEKEAT